MSYGRLVGGYNTQEEREQHVKEWGRYNDPLPNMKEITAEEFAQSGFFTWCINGIEFRQIDSERLAKGSLLSPLRGLFSCKIFYINGPGEDGFALTADYWEKKVRYFKFAKCYHDYEDVTDKNGKPIRNCYHYYTCRKCGHNWEVDSSD